MTATRQHGAPPALGPTVLAMAAFLSGCAAAGLPVVAEPALQQKAPRQTLVIGSVHVKPNARGFWTSSVSPRGQTVVFARLPRGEPGDERLFQRFDGNHFFVLLEPGSYAIRQVFTTLGGFFASGQVGLETDIPFDVPADGVVYIGAVEASFEYREHLGHRFTFSNFQFGVEDRYDDAKAEFRRRYPSVRRAVENRCVPFERRARLGSRPAPTPAGEPADPPEPADEGAAIETPAAPVTTLLEPGTTVSVLAEHGDAFGVRLLFERWLEKGGFRVVPAASAGPAVQLHLGYFTLARNLPARLRVTALDPSGTRVVAACRERERPADSAVGGEIFVRCVRALGGVVPDPPPPTLTY